MAATTCLFRAFLCDDVRLSVLRCRADMLETNPFSKDLPRLKNQLRIPPRSRVHHFDISTLTPCMFSYPSLRYQQTTTTASPRLIVTTSRSCCSRHLLVSEVVGHPIAPTICAKRAVATITHLLIAAMSTDKLPITDTGEVPCGTNA